MEPILELLSQLEELNASVVMEIPNPGLTASFNGEYLSHHYMYSFPEHLLGSLPAADQSQAQAALPHPIASASVAELGQEGRKKKGVVPAHDALSSQRSSTPVRSEPLLEQADVKKNKNSPGKRATGKSKEVKPKQVVHVRTRRGQATDSHSLAERSRRERINQRMRCLQDLVPGCYKTMGMAGMLDEIINYVQSLQNQVEFLSLKLSAASAINGCCFDMEAVTAPQGGRKHDAARVFRTAYGG